MEPLSQEFFGDEGSCDRADSASPSLLYIYFIDVLFVLWLAVLLPCGIKKNCRCFKIHRHIYQIVFTPQQPPRQLIRMGYVPVSSSTSPLDSKKTDFYNPVIFFLQHSPK